MGAIDTTYTFTATDTITSTKMNNIIDQTTITSDAIIGTTLEVASGKLKVRSANITSNELATNAVTTAAITDLNVTTGKIADLAVTTGKIADLGVTTAKIADANVTPAKLSQPSTLATVQNSTSGTSIDFTAIPSWVKCIKVMFNGVSTNGSSDYIIQIGDAGGIENTGYTSAASDRGGDSSSTIGFILTRTSGSSTTSYGIATICNLSSNSWVSSANISVTNLVSSSVGFKPLSDKLTQVRITTVNGTDTFDAGQINIIYE